jgi:hypothetical protein
VAAVALGIAVSAAIPGCLNPRPEELPSTLETQAVVPNPDEGGVVRETCSDNPLLAGCAPPDAVGGLPTVSSPNSPPLPSAPSPQDVGDAGDGTAGDAGGRSDPEADFDAGL